MAQPRPKPTPGRKVSTTSAKTLLATAALGLTIGSWAALSRPQPVEVGVAAAPVVASAPPAAPPLALSGPPIPTLVPLASPPLAATASSISPAPAPGLRPAQPGLSAPSISAPKPQARTRSSR